MAPRSCPLEAGPDCATHGDTMSENSAEHLGPTLAVEVERLRALISAAGEIEPWPYRPGSMADFELDESKGYNDARAEFRRALGLDEAR